MLPFHRCEEGYRVEVTCRGIYREARISTQPHPETLVLTPRPTFPPSLSFAPEPVALPGRELGKGGQDRSGEVSLLSSPTRAGACCEHPSPSFEKSMGCAKNHSLPQCHSTNTAAVVLFTRVGGVRAPRAALPGLAEGGCDSVVARRVPSAGLFPWSWAGAARCSALGYQDI